MKQVELNEPHVELTNERAVCMRPSNPESLESDKCLLYFVELWRLELQGSIWEICPLVQLLDLGSVWTKPPMDTKS